MSDGSELLRARVQFSKLLRECREKIKTVTVEFDEAGNHCFACALDAQGEPQAIVDFPFSTARWKRPGTPASVLKHFQETARIGGALQ